MSGALREHHHHRPDSLVGTKEQAEAICSNWKNQNEDVYAYLMDMLLR
ncbi:MAG: DUF4364 family protein [Agathobacter rectalis]